MLCSFLLKILMPNLNVAPSLDLTAFFNLFNCTFVNLQFTSLFQPLFISSMNLFNIL